MKLNRAMEFLRRRFTTEADAAVAEAKLIWPTSVLVIVMLSALLWAAIWLLATTLFY